MRSAESRRAQSPGIRHSATVPLDSERLILLMALTLGKRATATAVRTAAAELAGYKMARGLIYKVLETLEQAGLVRYHEPADGPRVHLVSAKGKAVLRTARDTSQRLWRLAAGKL